MKRRIEWIVAGGMVLAAAGARAQVPAVSAYYQHVALGSAAGPRSPAGALDAQRARLMWAPQVGGWSLDVAYEQTFWWRDAPATAGVGGVAASAASRTDWLHLGSTLHDGEHVSWRQRFDRLSLSYSSGSVTATVGRQAVSWATTLFLTPADPWVPFNPSDPFREYRTGIDAARVQWFASSFTVVDFVARPDNEPGPFTATALMRVKTAVHGWELSAWGGALHNSAAGAVGVTRTVAGSAARFEAEARDDSTSHAVVRSAIGVDRRFTVFDRDLYGVIEYQHDPLGAARASQIASAAASTAASFGEMQVFGRDESALQLQYQVHPLVSAELLALWNLRDGSALFSPAASISLTDDATARVGVYAPAGARGVPAAGPRSEYGPVPFTAYAALSVFF